MTDFIAVGGNSLLKKWREKKKERVCALCLCVCV